MRNAALFVALVMILVIVLAATFVWASEHQRVASIEPSPAATPLPAWMFTSILPAPTSDLVRSLQTHSAPPLDPPPRMPEHVAAGVLPKSTPSPFKLTQPSGRSLKGLATWYCLPSYPSACMFVHPDPAGMYAAAGPSLRAAIGPSWRNKKVSVSVNGRTVVVQLADWCLCTGSGSSIDLYSGPFAYLSGRSKSSPGGGLDVTIRW